MPACDAEVSETTSPSSDRPQETIGARTRLSHSSSKYIAQSGLKALARLLARAAAAEVDASFPTDVE